MIIKGTRMDNQEVKKQNRINRRPITSLLIGLGFLSIIFLTMMLSSPRTAVQERKARGNASGEKEQEKLTLGDCDGEILAVITGIDTANREITLLNTGTGESIVLAYSGGSDITDKYEQIVTAGQIPIGMMVDAGYRKDTLKLVRMQVSKRAWEYIDVSNLGIDREAKRMKVGANKYKYTDDIIILDGEKFITAEDLREQDLLTLRGVDEVIWSVTVNKGHGTVKLIDTEGFLGGHVTVGYEAMQEIAENMEITVREGNYNLTVENGKYSATKNINITRNEETVVSLEGLGQMPEKTSQITFDISPFGADLFIDDALTSYANPVEMTYGEHTIAVSLGGYTTYRGKLTVKEADQTVKIALPEASSKKDAEVAVTEKETSPEETRREDERKRRDRTPNGNDSYSIDEDHFIYVQNPLNASVYLNGEYMGTSPVGFEKIIGSHVITFIKDGYEVQSYTIEVEDDGMDTFLSMPDLEPFGIK
jgi:hypothetical protein